MNTMTSLGPVLTNYFKQTMLQHLVYLQSMYKRRKLTFHFSVEHLTVLRVQSQSTQQDNYLNRNQNFDKITNSVTFASSHNFLETVWKEKSTICWFSCCLYKQHSSAGIGNNMRLVYPIGQRDLVSLKHLTGNLPNTGLRPAHYEYKEMGAWFRCLCSSKIDVSIASSSLRLHHIHVLVNFLLRRFVRVVIGFQCCPFWEEER